MEREGETPQRDARANADARHGTFGRSDTSGVGPIAPDPVDREARIAEWRSLHRAQRLEDERLLALDERQLRTRDERRMWTKARIMRAARKLFHDPGYAETTIRMIAEEAGISQGGMFGHFESKEDLLLAIGIERYGDLADHLDEVLSRREGSVRERMKKAFAEGYAFQYGWLEMLSFQIAASWTWSTAFEQENREAIARPFSFVEKLLEEAACNGEIAPWTDVAALADLLMAAYLRNFRHARYKGFTAGTMAAHAARQIDLLFDGAAPR